MSTVISRPVTNRERFGTQLRRPSRTPFAEAEYGFSFIKSGFEDVQENLESDLRGFGIEVIGSSSIMLKPEVVDYIYRDSLEQPFYGAMHHYLTNTAVIAMALHGEGQNTQETVNDLKCGTNGRPSLRRKYARNDEPVPKDEVYLWYEGTHPNQDDITIRLTQNNVFHAADTSDEAVESLRLLGTHNPEFLNAVRRNRRGRTLARHLFRSVSTPLVVS